MKTTADAHRLGDVDQGDGGEDEDDDRVDDVPDDLAGDRVQSEEEEIEAGHRADNQSGAGQNFAQVIHKTQAPLMHRAALPGSGKLPSQDAA